MAVVDSGIDGAQGPAGAVAVEPRAGDPAAVRIVAEAPVDVAGHGSACAAIVRGLAPAAELHSVRVLDPDLRASGAQLVAAIRWCVDHAFDVVNLSLSTRRDEHVAALHELADLAYFRGVALVCAVDNVPAPSAPSQFAAVLSVAAGDVAGPLALRRNPRPPPELLAHGESNSFAAATVSGLVARVRSKHPGLRPPELKAVLLGLAES